MDEVSKLYQIKSKTGLPRQGTSKNLSS
jgi:hypothetical protein